jgi:homopolymeric O-antigen transport system ATP-binding protein
MSVILRVENLSKVYRLGELNRGVFLRDWRRKLIGDTTEVAEDDPNVFWALRDVSFEVKQGEVVGLLGRNGAGKSTLLKVLAQITAPTHGCVKLGGRVASLLEVGTGFHQEMTGRENVYLNGTILGMSHREVQAKFDEIVAFSGIEEFIDTPVKRYSIGMRVRLAFAVAAHLEPEILLVDEVLAVGDAAFQQRCLGKVGEVAKAGRTVLFVSHNAAAVESLCGRGLVLQSGKLMFDGSQMDALEYLASEQHSTGNDLESRTDRTGTGEIRIATIALKDAQGRCVGGVRAGQDIELALGFRRKVAQQFPQLTVQIFITTHLGAPVFTQGNLWTGQTFGEIPVAAVFSCRIPKLPLPPGHYRVGFRVTGDHRDRDVLDAMDHALDFSVDTGDFFGSGKLPPLKGGTCLVSGEWKIQTGPETTRSELETVANAPAE